VNFNSHDQKVFLDEESVTLDAIQYEDDTMKISEIWHGQVENESKETIEIPLMGKNQERNSISVSERGVEDRVDEKDINDFQNINYTENLCSFDNFHHQANDPSVISAVNLKTSSEAFAENEIRLTDKNENFEQLIPAAEDGEIFIKPHNNIASNEINISNREYSGISLAEVSPNIDRVPINNLSTYPQRKENQFVSSEAILLRKRCDDSKWRSYEDLVECEEYKTCEQSVITVEEEDEMTSPQILSMLTDDEYYSKG
jgi:hypothetical protein